MSCIVVFGRQPVPGNVKTRLASDIGDVAAASVYGRLLAHTLEVVTATGEEVVLSLADDPEQGWTPPRGVRIEIQSNGRLGQRMLEAFGRRFAEGHSRVVIVGSDCARLTSKNLRTAMNLLAKHRVVLGPASDGGYWAVGQRRPGVDMFTSIPWSSADTLDCTRARLRGMGILWTEMEELPDLDTVADLCRDLNSAEVPPGLGFRLRQAAGSACGECP